jgi:pimeloyl-ACP methyl ester carboxylesterase
LAPWVENDTIIGYAHRVNHPRAVWLMTHGNAGQASGRGYVVPHVAPNDSLYVLEYPGYGLRAGAPSRDAMNAAAAAAYRILRREFPSLPVGAVGESIGTGPAAFLATLPDPPDRIVLIVPFDTLASVAAEHMPLLPTGLLLRDRWNNIEALGNYSRPVEIYGAENDRIIPCAHARNLAAHLPGAIFTVIPGGHNDWSDSALVRIGH